MRARSNRPGAAQYRLGAVLALLVVAACGGNAQSGVDESVDQGRAESPAPSSPGNPSEAPVTEGPVPSVGQPDDLDLDTPSGPPRRECPWERRGAMPEGRVGMGFAGHDGRVYLFGGRSEEQSKQSPGAGLTLSALNVYDPAADDWSRPGEMPIDSGDVSAVSVGAFMYVFAGMGSGSFISRGYRYDAAANTWLARAPMRVNRSNFTTVAVGSKVYLIGGNGQVDDGPSTSGEWVAKAGLEIYDTLTDSWSEGTPAPGAIENGASCVFGTRIYVFDGTVSGATYIYDTTTNSWTVGARAPEARHWASCAAYSGMLLLMGGRTPLAYQTDRAPTGPGNTIESSTVIQAYAPEINTWQDGGRLLRAREQFAAVTVGEEVYVIGGAESHTNEGPYGTVVVDEVTALTTAFCEVR